MKNVDDYLKVRHAVRIEGLSERAAARRFGIDPRTVSKMMKFSVPPGYKRKKPPAKPKLDPFVPVIDRILRDDKSQPKKQQHTAKRIFERLRDEYGFTGGITIVKDYVAGWRQRMQEMFVPLVHPPGHAQADFGEAIGIIGGVERKIHFFAFDLPHSDACFVVGYPAETTEPSATATFGRSQSSAGFHNRSCMTTPRLRWPASSVTASGNGRACSPSCNPITCSRIGLADSAKATTGQSRRAGRLCAPELPRSNPSVRELRGVERPSAGMLSPSND